MQLIDGRPVYSATDLVGFLACSHRLALERAALAGLARSRSANDPQIELVAKRGHRPRAALSRRAGGERPAAWSRSSRTARSPIAATELRGAAAAATDRGDARRRRRRLPGDVLRRPWVGFADFLLRVERPSALGAWSYEVADTKLARHVKAGAILQICSYVEQLTAIQGVEPEQLHVVLGGSAHETESLRVADFMAYYRRVKAEFEAAVAAGEPVYPVTATYPEPVEHCDVCRWDVHCRAQRRADDDLSLVAGITAAPAAGPEGRGACASAPRARRARRCRCGRGSRA